MTTETDTLFKRWMLRVRNTPAGRLFWDKRFFHYTWIGVFISLLNIFLLWLLIDVFFIHTVVASTLVVLLTFVLRYVLFAFAKIV